jgi:hypothetical protein
MNFFLPPPLVHYDQLKLLENYDEMYRTDRKALQQA